MDTPSIRCLRPEDGSVLIVTWKSGAESVVDLGPFLSQYAIFSLLRDNDPLFKAVKVGDWGWSAHWTEDMEVSADTLWRLSLEQGASWLRSWREARGLTEAAAATALGVGPRLWRQYEAGTHLLPKTVRLACLGYDTQSRAA